MNEYIQSNDVVLLQSLEHFLYENIKNAYNDERVKETLQEANRILQTGYTTKNIWECAIRTFLKGYYDIYGTIIKWGNRIAQIGDVGCKLRFV